MVGVNDAGRILESFFGIHFIEKLQIFIVIVRMCLTMLINSTTKNRVCIEDCRLLWHPIRGRGNYDHAEQQQQSSA